jgi:peptide/nickel transport system ATP-binding protein
MLMEKKEKDLTLIKRSKEKEPLLQVYNLSKYFPVNSVFKLRHVHAVEDISFDVNRGEVVAIVGESGSGKSTTVRMIARLIPVTRGKIIFQGKDILKEESKIASEEYRRKVQMIFQDPFSSLNSVHTIEHHIARPLIIHKLVKNRKDLHKRVYDLLSIVGLEPAKEIARRYPHQLSGGQRQRVSIARALAVTPELILADEPISMLDVSIRIGIINLLAQLKKELSLAFVYITHDLASARYFSNRILVMYAGHMVEGGPSEEIMGKPSHPYTQLLLSAVPDPHAGLRTMQNFSVHGEVPSLVDPPPGCPFAPRCSRVMDQCRRAMPQVRFLNKEHWTRCYLYE